MSKKKTWADISKGDVVELGGRPWSVVKIKAKGKKAKVIVEHKGREADSIVKLSDPVAIVKPKAGPLYEKVTPRASAQARWAKKSETTEPRGLPAGDPEKTKPPKKATGGPWETPADRIEEKLDKLLSARLVGEASDENAGYYVPPVDVSTVASHLALFHGGIPDAAADDEGRMLAAHTAQHAAITSAPLAVNHWHTATRP